MTTKALLAAFVLAIACTSVALAADYSVSSNNSGNSVTVSNSNTYSDGQWSGQWVGGDWTPGYWADGSWHEASWDNTTGDWTVSVDGGDYSLSDDDWNAIPQAPMPSSNMTPRSTSAVDNARSAEYVNGAVKGYTSSDRDASAYGDMDKAADAAHDNDNDKDDHYEGAKCGGSDNDGCGCSKCGSKCGGGCGSKCGSKCGSCNKCGSKCGGGCGSKCGSKCGSCNKCGGGCGSKCGSKCGSGGCGKCGGSCPGSHYDKWGVYQGPR